MCGIGLEGIGWRSVYVRYSDAYMNTFFGDSLGRVILFVKSSVLSENCPNYILGMYNVSHM